MPQIACIQMRSGVAPGPNIAAASEMIRAAAARGATLVATPEMTNILDIRPGAADGRIVPEADDAALAAFTALAAELGIWLLIGSLAVALPGDTRKANRSILISPAGDITARYDKIHMFDVDVGDGQTYRESDAYRPGKSAVVAETPIGKLGLTICYDVRFPALYRALAQAGAEIIFCPAAFTRVTGKAHWHALLRARAIETGCYLIAPAQGGQHEDGRKTFGHSMIVSPWGEIAAEANDDEPGIILAEVDLANVAAARRKIASLTHDRPFAIDRR